MEAEIRKGWARNSATNILRVAIVLLFLGLATWAITLNRYELVIANHEPWLWLTVALVSMGPELAGIVIGVVTIDYLDERRQVSQLKEQLIIQMRSKHNDVTDTAIRVFGARGWLYDGSLRRVDLSGANLSGADLSGANLSGADLTWANLSGALLRNAKLGGAILLGADLSMADLIGADLSRADLEGAKLNNAILGQTDLSGAMLAEADLSEAVSVLTVDESGVTFTTNLGGAYLGGARLSGTGLWKVNLRGVRGWSIEQLEQASTLDGATMPDGAQLEEKAVDGGLSFEKWKTQYQAKFGGTESEIRRGNEPDSELDDRTDG